MIPLCGILNPDKMPCFGHFSNCYSRHSNQYCEMSFFTLPNMPPSAAQTITESVQVIGASLEESLLRFFRVKKLCSAKREIT
jgi:hypothetical protein